MKFFLGGALSNANTQFVDKIVGYERSIIGNVLNVVRIFGTGIALIMLTWMSISYFTADGRSFRGAIERKAAIKGTQLVNFAIGVVIINTTTIIFILTNVLIVSQSFAISANTQLQPVSRGAATITKLLFALAQVTASGYFIFRFTMDGIAYFTVTAAQDKAASKKRIEWTIFYAVITYVSIFLFAKTLGV